MVKGRGFWGPVEWKVIHSIPIVLTADNTDKYSEYLWLSTKLLPCDVCQRNLTKKLNQYAPVFKDGRAAFMFSYILHDLVNQHVTRYRRDEKISPPFENVVQYYHDSMKEGEAFLIPNVWSVMYIRAATYKPETDSHFRRFLFLLSEILPYEKFKRDVSAFLTKYPVDPYLRNNHDLFFYIYAMQTSIEKTSTSFESIKNYYYSSLGQECDDCRL